MTTTINNQMAANFAASANQMQPQLSKEVKHKDHLQFFNKGFGVGAGLFSDFGNGLKLANAWTSAIKGHVTESSQKMTDAGYVVKNITTALEGPGNFNAAVQDWSKMRKTGTVGSIMNFFASVLMTGKCFYEGMELLAARFSLLPITVLKDIKPLSPAGTFAYASREVISKQIPDLKENFGTRESCSTLLRLGKCVALAAVGAFSLIAIFFQPIVANWVYPVLLTTSLACSVSYKFFDHLMLPDHFHKSQDKGVLV